MDVIRRSEQKIQRTEEEITEGPGKDVHMLEELDSNKHDNPHEFCNEEILYHVDDQISI
jgi:hypothetical protein